MSYGHDPIAHPGSLRDLGGSALVTGGGTDTQPRGRASPAVAAPVREVARMKPATSLGGMPRRPEPTTSKSAGAAGHADQDAASLAGRSDRPDRRGQRGPVPRGSGAAPDRTSVGSATASAARAAEAASTAAPARLPRRQPQEGMAPSTARGTDVHRQDHRDRTIPAAVIVVVFFVAILVAALIWLAAG